MTPEEKRERRTRWIVTAGLWFVRMIALTWRFRVRNDEELKRYRAERKPVIFSLWHGQMLPLLYHHRGEGVAVLISEHGDGEIIARIAMRLGFRTVRGSTSRGAARALLGLVREIEEGNDLAVTPDGPRGPEKSFAPGALIVAQRGNAPILPTIAVASSGWRLKSWDRFLIPKPFARVTIAYGPMMHVDASSTRDAVSFAEQARGAMLAVEESASV